jgi:5-methyltetrahydrofolate--homocysteine methyltransferase
MAKMLLEVLKERRLVCDGAMGTQLMLAGLEQGGCGESWNLAHPERVLAIQKCYVGAGADCIITNTFGGNRIMLARHRHADDTTEINKAAGQIARAAFDGKPGFVLGDIGPVGGVLEPYGDLKASDVAPALREQAKALVAAGVDAIIIETQTSLEELGLAVQAAREAGAPCVIGSLAYDRSPDGTFFRTMMGVSPEQAAEFVREHGGDVIALNCGTGMDMAGAAEVVALYRSVTNLFTMAQPNAGLPKLVNLKAVYKQTPAEMVQALPVVLAAGANIVGSCCGSTPDHTRAIRHGVNQFNQNQNPHP